MSSAEKTHTDEQVYMVDVTIALPFEHSTEELAHKRGDRVIEYVLQQMPDASVTYIVSHKVKDAEQDKSV